AADVEDARRMAEPAEVARQLPADVGLAPGRETDHHQRELRGVGQVQVQGSPDRPARRTAWAELADALAGDAEQRAPHGPGLAPAEREGDRVRTLAAREPGGRGARRSRRTSSRSEKPRFSETRRVRCSRQHPAYRASAA